jgi:hypothetical protein
VARCQCAAGGIRLWDVEIEGSRNARPERTEESVGDVRVVREERPSLCPSMHGRRTAQPST